LVLVAAFAAMFAVLGHVSVFCCTWPRVAGSAALLSALECVLMLLQHCFCLLVLVAAFAVMFAALGVCRCSCSIVCWTLAPAAALTIVICAQMHVAACAVLFAAHWYLLLLLQHFLPRLCVGAAAALWADVEYVLLLDSIVICARMHVAACAVSFAARC
jgi:hypothetical protein